MCRSHSTVREILGTILEDTKWSAVTDMEAGLEHLKRGTIRHVGTMLIIMEPYFKSLEMGLRSRQLAEELGIPRLAFVANKIRNSQDQQVIEDFCDKNGMELTAIIPHDDTILDADQLGKAPLDLNADCEAIKAIKTLAGKIQSMEAA